jgi:hypothetical protein
VEVKIGTKHKDKYNTHQAWWHTSVTPVLGMVGKDLSEFEANLLYKSRHCLSADSSPVILPTQEAEIRSVYRDLMSALAKFNTLPQKYPTQKRISRVAKVVESFPSKREALSSNPSTEKNKTKQQKKITLSQKTENQSWLYMPVFPAI